MEFEREVVTERMIPGDQYNFVPSGNGQGLKRKTFVFYITKAVKKKACMSRTTP